jgi:hypothetical protein
MYLFPAKRVAAARQACGCSEADGHDAAGHEREASNAAATSATSPHPCQAKALIAWRAAARPPRAARLSPQEREVLAVQHNRRLLDVASKACLAVIKAMMVQKVRGGQRGRTRGPGRHALRLPGSLPVSTDFCLTMAAFTG